MRVVIVSAASSQRRQPVTRRDISWQRYLGSYARAIASAPR
ncbi:MAG: hypothetical protein AABO58_25010 [Acidobacteriota bacterium]